MNREFHRIARWLGTVTTVLCLAMPAVAQAEVVGVKEATNVAIAVEVITKIDKDARTFTVKNDAGEAFEFVAGPEVRNFDQLKRGDLVIIEYYQGFAIALEPKGSGLKERVSEVTVAKAKQGEKPGIKVTTTTYAAAEVAAVDTETRLVALQGAQGVLVLKTGDDVDLSGVQVGQEVEALYAESFSVSVVAAPKVSGKVSMKLKAVAVGVGVEWGAGRFTRYDGESYDFKVKGLTVADVGVSSVEAAGEVYNLVEAKDLEGTFVSGAAGATLVGGGSVVAMKNGNGVVIKLRSSQKGVRLTFAGGGMKVTLK